MVGAALAMKAREIIERAVLLARQGTEGEGSTSPAERFETRLDFLRRTYLTVIAPDSDGTDLDFEPAEFVVLALEFVYEGIAASITERYVTGVRLHSNWAVN